MRDPKDVIWNLFLAIVPVVLGFIIARYVRDQRDHRRPISWIVAGPMLAVWLLFLPNTCYLLTEWRHYLNVVVTNPAVFLLARHDTQALYQFLTISIFYILYSGSGMLTFFLAIWPVDRVFKVSAWGKAIFFLLCSLGVYLGLVKRYNSWSVAHRPGEIAQSAFAALARPEIDLLMVAFASMLWIAYLAFEIFMDGLEIRRRRLMAK